MPRQKCTTVYQFDELSDDAKEKAREWWREGALDYDWYDTVEDDFKEICKLIGIEVSKIYFSGFWSQGDGACFEGSFSYKKGGTKKLIEYAPQDKELHRIAKEFAAVQKKNFYQIQGNIVHSGHYYHKYETNINLARYDNLDHDLPITETDKDAIEELLRDLMDWLYRILEKEYEYLQSDEQVDETIKINEYEFTEEGHTA